MNDLAQLNFLKSQDLLPSNVFLDFGCGQLDGGIPIVEYLDEGNYFGTDVRIRILVDGQRNMKAAGLKKKKKPNFVHLDTYEALPFSDRFDFIWAFSVLTHLNDHQIQKALNFAAQWLKIDGHFLANVTKGEAKDGDWEGFPKVSRSVHFYEEKAKVAGLKMKNLGRLSELGFDHTDDQEIMLSFCKEI